MRHTNGRWAPGQSGNPGGRPGGVAAVRELARNHTAEAIECLLKEMRKGDTSHARIAAANALLDRGWGRPTQPLAGDAEEPPVEIRMTRAELAEQARRRIDEAFREYRAPGYEEERPNGPVIERRSSPAPDGDRSEPVAEADRPALPVPRDFARPRSLEAVPGAARRSIPRRHRRPLGSGWAG